MEHTGATPGVLRQGRARGRRPEAGVVKGRLCKGCLFYSSVLRSKGTAPSASASPVWVSGELYFASPSALAGVDLLEGTHLGIYERRRITIVVDGTSNEVEAEAYLANASYAEALWLRCGGKATEIAEYTMEHADRYVPPSGRSSGVSGLMDAVRGLLSTAPPVN